MAKKTTIESIDFLTEKPTKLKIQTKCGPLLKQAVLNRASELKLDESKYLRRLVVKDITENN